MHLRIIKIGEFFCVAILIVKVENNTLQHFWHVILYYFKKGKNATEIQKKIKGFVQCLEKVCLLYTSDAADEDISV